VCSGNTKEKSSCHIIILAYKGALEWVQTSNGQASGQVLENSRSTFQIKFSYDPRVFKE
jgi:hypothetical protein